MISGSIYSIVSYKDGIWMGKFVSEGASQIWQTAARATAALQILQQFITSLQICSQGSDQQKNFINAWYQLYIV